MKFSRAKRAFIATNAFELLNPMLLWLLTTLEAVMTMFKQPELCHKAMLLLVIVIPCNACRNQLREEKHLTDLNDNGFYGKVFFEVEAEINSKVAIRGSGDRGSQELAINGQIKFAWRQLKKHLQINSFAEDFSILDSKIDGTDTIITYKAKVNLLRQKSNHDGLLPQIDSIRNENRPPRLDEFTKTEFEITLPVHALDIYDRYKAGCIEVAPNLVEIEA